MSKWSEKARSRYLEEDNDVTIVTYQGSAEIYTLVQDLPRGKLKVEASGFTIAQWNCSKDYTKMTLEEVQKTADYKKFLAIVDRDEQTFSNYEKNKAGYSDDYDEGKNYSSYSSYSSDYWKNWAKSYVAPKKSTGFAETLKNSDTLVIHCADNSTDMLSQIYEGRGWDVLRDGNIDDDELIDLIKCHNKIICLGHGSPSGLINVQGYGTVINSMHVPYLKDKKLFCIWCYAATFLKNHGLHGHFCSDNAPSEKWECKVVGFDVSAEWILESITYWCKCCADVVDQALNGDPEGAVENARKAYLDKYGDDPNPEHLGVSKFNANTLQVS